MSLHTDHCGGTLVLHDDGSAALCTYEVEGLPCAGIDAMHAAVTSCTSFLGADGCETCSPELWEPEQLRHAVRIGHVMVMRRRCALHRAPAVSHRHGITAGR